MNNVELNIDDRGEVILPGEALTWTLAILAKKGAGKTWTAGVMEEEFARHGLPFVVLDPVGNHWGIRSTADGKRESPYPVVVFGGQHGDVPIERRMGAAIADAVMEENVSAVLDLTELSKSAWRQVVTDFCHRLYRRNRDFSPRHVFIEEATEFVPQTRRPEMQVAYEAVERLVRMGRSRGLGCTLISQRSAQVAKDVLSQIDVLIALRTVGRHDRKALEDMFGDVLEQDQLADLEEFKRTVAGLPDGDAWVWSPEKLRCFTCCHIRERETYHAGATPGFERVKVVQARPDVSGLRARFAALAEVEEEEKRPAPVRDTAAGGAGAETERLRRQVVELEKSRAGLEEKVKRVEAVQATTQADFEAALEGNRAALALKEALLGFIGVKEFGQVKVEALPDLDTVTEAVLARLGSDSPRPVQVTPPDALRKRHLQAAVERVYGQVEALGPEARRVMELLLAQDRSFTVNEISQALSGNTGGNTRQKWGRVGADVHKLGLVAKGSHGYKAVVRRCLEVELAPHGPTQEELAAVEAQVVYRLVEA